MGLDRDHELDELLAERAITRIIHHYAHAADRGDVPMMEACFWPDAVLNLGMFQGTVAAFIDGFRTGAADVSRVSRHLLGNILIEVHLAEHEARAETYCTGGGRVRDGSGTLVDRIAHVRYVDRFEERAGEWRIHRRVVAFDWATVVPVNGESTIQPNYVLGTRGPGDIWEHILDRD